MAWWPGKALKRKESWRNSPGRRPPPSRRRRTDGGVLRARASARPSAPLLTPPPRASAASERLLRLRSLGPCGCNCKGRDGRENERRRGTARFKGKARRASCKGGPFSVERLVASPRRCSIAQSSNAKTLRLLPVLMLN
jgi:hypothetical protein